LREYGRTHCEEQRQQHGAVFVIHLVSLLAHRTSVVVAAVAAAVSRVWPQSRSACQVWPRSRCRFAKDIRSMCRHPAARYLRKDRRCRETPAAHRRARDLEACACRQQARHPMQPSGRRRSAPVGRGASTSGSRLVAVALRLVRRPFIERTGAVAILYEIESLAIRQQIQILTRMGGLAYRGWKWHLDLRPTVPQNHCHQERCCRGARSRGQRKESPERATTRSGCFDRRMSRLIEARANTAVDAQHALFEHQARLPLEL